MIDFPGLMTMAMGGLGGGQGGAAGQGQSGVFWVVWLALMIGIFYFMMIRPQQRKEKERRSLIESVKTNDRIIFAGGLVGLVTNVKQHVLIVKVGDSTKLEVLKSAVQKVLQKDEDITGDVKE